ncbi:MAG: Hsp20/alpha crystallin family protein [Trueperaceae bacterium]|nr:Hsp20/alpha crystallin family protein [Trueperaceae bacterium]
MALDKLTTVTDLDSTASDLEKLLTLRGRISELHNEFDVRQDVSPRVDLLDLGDAFRLVVEVPGVHQDDLEIALHGDELTIAGIRHGYTEDSGSNDDAFSLLVGERRLGHFQRTITIPDSVDYERSSAQLRNGLLSIDLPKV